MGYILSSNSFCLFPPSALFYLHFRCIATPPRKRLIHKTSNERESWKTHCFQRLEARRRPETPVLLVRELDARSRNNIIERYEATAVGAIPFGWTSSLEDVSKELVSLVFFFCWTNSKWKCGLKPKSTSRT